MIETREVIRRDVVGLLGAALLRDWDLQGRLRSRQHPSVDETWLGALPALLELLAWTPLVYTAFDGDQQQLSPYMRAFVLASGGVPVNPPSVIGYKESVDAHSHKPGVLLDDLAILDRSDELLVFTDKPPTPDSLASLAEGVIVEILYVLATKRQPTIRFISPLPSFSGLNAALPYAYGFQESLNALHPDQVDGVHGLLDRAIDRGDRKVLFHIIDPADFKYAPWLREQSYREGFVPVVPPLAVDAFDLGNEIRALGHAVLAWLKLADLASDARVVTPMDERRTPSTIVFLHETTWPQHRNLSRPVPTDWRYYGIPKAVERENWPLTRREAEELAHADGPHQIPVLARDGRTSVVRLNETRAETS